MNSINGIEASFATQFINPSATPASMRDSVVDDPTGADRNPRDLRSKIATAAISALSDSRGSGDPRRAVFDAIEGVLREEGIEGGPSFEEFSARIDERMGAGGFPQELLSGIAGAIAGGSGEARGAALGGDARLGELRRQIEGRVMASIQGAQDSASAATRGQGDGSEDLLMELFEALGGGRSDDDRGQPGVVDRSV